MRQPGEYKKDQMQVTFWKLREKERALSNEVTSPIKTSGKEGKRCCCQALPRH